MAVKITQKYELFKDVDGDPLENGYIYIGTIGLNPETSPITVYFDEALTLPASQPLRTSGGYIQNAGTPVNIYTDSDYSITVRNKNESLIYTSLSNNAEAGLASSVDTIGDLIGLDEAATVGELDVYGYHTKGDSAGGLFVWDSTTSKADANAGTIIDPTVSLANQGTGVGTGCWIRQYDGDIKLEYFGIVSPSYVKDNKWIWDDTVNKNTANLGTIIDPTVGLTVVLQGTGSGNGCMIRQYRGRLDLKAFGAKYDDTDESAMLVSVCALGIKLTTGSNRLSISKSTINDTVDIEGNFKVHSAVTGNNILEFYGDDSKIKIDIDCNSKGVIAVILYGDTIHADVTVYNMNGVLQATGGVQSGLIVSSDNCEVTINAYDISKGTSDNDSIPRIITTENTSNNTLITNIIGRNVNCGWVQNSPNATCNNLFIDTITDNGVYSLSGITVLKDAHINNCIDEPIVAATSTVHIDSLNLVDCNGANGVQSATLHIGLMTISTTSSAYKTVPCRTRVGNVSSRVYIGKLTGDLRMTEVSNGGAIFQFQEGAVNLSVDNIDLYLRYYSGSTASFVNHDNGDTLNIGRIKLILDDTTSTLTGSDVLKWNMPTVTRDSFLGRVSMYAELASLRLADALQPLLYIDNSNEVFLSYIIGKQLASTQTPRRLSGSSAPSSGTWIVGDIIYDITPSAGGTIGWVCITAGTPGTWKTFGAITA